MPYLPCTVAPQATTKSRFLDAGNAEQHCQSAPLAVPARSASTPPQDVFDSPGWLGAPMREAGPLGAQPLPRVLELAASKAAGFPPPLTIQVLPQLVNFAVVPPYARV